MELVGAGLRAGTFFQFGPAGTPGPTGFLRFRVPLLARPAVGPWYPLRTAGRASSGTQFPHSYTRRERAGLNGRDGVASGIAAPATWQSLRAGPVVRGAVALQRDQFASQ